jgi:hypothetical protein
VLEGHGRSARRPIERKVPGDLVGGIGRQRSQQADAQAGGQQERFLHDDSSLISLCFRR